jgi:hypothetical protein
LRRTSTKIYKRIEVNPLALGSMAGALKFSRMPNPAIGKNYCTAFPRAAEIQYPYPYRAPLCSVIPVFLQQL